MQRICRSEIGEMEADRVCSGAVGGSIPPHSQKKCLILKFDEL